MYTYYVKSTTEQHQNCQLRGMLTVLLTPYLTMVLQMITILTHSDGLKLDTGRQHVLQLELRHVGYTSNNVKCLSIITADIV
jgi:hypothetical protein